MVKFQLTSPPSPISKSIFKAIGFEVYLSVLLKFYIYVLLYSSINE